MSAIRSATVADLPRIVDLIRQSFAAMAEHYGNPSFNHVWTQAVEEAEKEDINAEQFLLTYFSSPGSSFWVVEDQTSGVVACAGLKRKSSDEAELVRMSVDSSSRGRGTGSILMRHILAHCKAHKLSRVLMTTGNPLSQGFYEKCGFSTVKTWTRTLDVPDAGKLELSVFHMTYYVGAKIIRRVGITGGTHGNELLGVELVKRWQLNQGTEGRDELLRSTLQCVPVLSNLPAIAANRRYVDKDLNRQFRRQNLDAILTKTADEQQQGEEEDYSVARLHALLGPKTEFYTQPTGVDFIIDMHSSTSNLGSMLILGCLTHDNLAARAAYDAKQRFAMGTAGVLSSGVLRVASVDVTKEVSHWLDR
jgi:N-acetylglutamate synthase-like GNAT family acetyltransferase